MNQLFSSTGLKHIIVTDTEKEVDFNVLVQYPTLSEPHIEHIGPYDFQGLKDADLVVIGKSDIAGPEKIKTLKKFLQPHLPVGVEFAEVGFRPNGFYNAANDLVLKADEIKGRKVKD